MGKPYEPFDHTADIGLLVRGRTLEELFENAAAGLFDLMIGLDRVRPREERTVEVAAADEEELLVNWLNELLYLFEVEGLALRGFQVRRFSPTRLEAAVRGEAFDPERHPIAAEIKAATYHQLRLEQVDGEWRTRLVFDV